MKSVHIWSFSGPYFPAFQLNTERYPVSLKCGKTRARKTPNTDTFHAINCRFTYAGNWELLKPIAGTKFGRSHVCLHFQAGNRNKQG